MKKIILFLVLFVCQNFYSQENQKSKLQIHSFSVTLGGFNPQKGNNERAIWYTDFNLTANHKKNLFAVSVDGAFDWLFSFFGEKTKRQNVQISMLYGREIKLIKNVHFEALTGIGYFKAIYRTDDFITWEDDFSFIKNRPDISVKKLSLNSLSVPVKLRLVLDYSKNGSVGLNYSQSFNSISNYSSTGLIFRYKF